MNELMAFTAPKYILLSCFLWFRTVVETAADCLVTHNVQKYRNTFVHGYVPCPRLKTDCEGIGEEPSLNCYKCCSFAGADDSPKESIWATWGIAVIAGSAVVALILIFGLPAITIFFVRRRQSLYSDNLQRSDSTDSTTTSESHQHSDETSSTISIVGEPTVF